MHEGGVLAGATVRNPLAGDGSPEDLQRRLPWIRLSWPSGSQDGDPDSYNPKYISL